MNKPAKDTYHPLCGEKQLVSKKTSKEIVEALAQEGHRHGVNVGGLP